MTDDMSLHIQYLSLVSMVSSFWPRNKRRENFAFLDINLCLRVEGGGSLHSDAIDYIQEL
jgi:hypothetical protein